MSSLSCTAEGPLCRGCWLMRVKSFEALTASHLHGVELRCHPRHLTMIKIMRSSSIALVQLYSEMFTCRNCGGGDRGRVAIYRPFGEFRRAKIVLSPVWCSRPTTGVLLAHATMNFMGLDLTTSDRWQKTTTEEEINGF
ncbi:hypothetical protein TNCV_3001051 [Trichonephila clavipes]|nr:hypothetical protein TNCV_3001051 [Trichonephila clavipes]